MKSILNKGVHEILKLAHTPVVCSDADETAYLNRASKMQQEISEWLGTTVYEKVSLGQNCNASWYLKASENKRASYPFDWLFTTPDIIEDMLANNFEAFLDKNQLISRGLDAGHKRYHGWLFGHRNPAKSTSDFHYFERCIARWNELMQAQKPVLFVTVVLNEFDKRKRWREGFSKHFEMPKDQKLEDFESMMNRITAINPNSKFLFIEQYTEASFELEIKAKTEQAFWLKFCSIDKNTGVQYLHEVDDKVIKNMLKALKQ